ncbi:MAG: hypothetical protein Tsb0013_16360 [Phycisphaerales bacterium]
MDHSADQWVIACTRCGRTAPARESGVYRAFASSKCKRVMARCSSCGRTTLAHLTKDRARADALRAGEA